MLKNKIWTNPQIKNHKKSHELRLARSQMQNKNPGHVFEILNATKTICGVDGTDDGMLWNGIKENKNVRSECEEDEGTDWEGGDSDTDW